MITFLLLYTCTKISKFYIKKQKQEMYINDTQTSIAKAKLNKENKKVEIDVNGWAEPVKVYKIVNNKNFMYLKELKQ